MILDYRDYIILIGANKLKIKTILLIVLTLLIVVILMVKKCRPCELVCMARTDLQADSPYETNDVVDVLKDGTIAKLKIDNPKAFMLRADIFTVIYVPDLSVAEARTKYLVHKTDTNAKDLGGRLYKIDTTKIAVVKGEATTNKATLATQVIKKAVAVALPE